MNTKHFLTLEDLGIDGLQAVLLRASGLKTLRGMRAHPSPLRGKSVLLLFEKSSTRTRISFDVGVAELGGHPVALMGRDIQLGRGEPLPDTARMFERFAHAVVYRTFGHDRIEGLAADSHIPIVNALTDKFHPCQLLADLQTVREAFGAELQGTQVAWIGDGNNMAHSWILAAGMLGLDLRIACPEGYDPLPDVMESGAKFGRGSVTVVRDPQQAAKGARVVTTDVWTSMGQEEEAKARIEAFAGYCVDSDMMAKAASDAIFLHCLPAHRGEEVAAEVIDGPQSRVWDEAENRLHAQKALLEHLIGAS